MKPRLEDLKKSFLKYPAKESTRICFMKAACTACKEYRKRKNRAEFILPQYPWRFCRKRKLQTSQSVRRILRWKPTAPEDPAAKMSIKWRLPCGLSMCQPALLSHLKPNVRRQETKKRRCKLCNLKSYKYSRKNSKKNLETCEKSKSAQPIAQKKSELIIFLKTGSLTIESSRAGTI